METSRIQVDCLEDMDYLVNNLSSYLLSQFPEENTLIDQVKLEELTAL